MKMWCIYTTLILLVKLYYGKADISCCSVCDCTPHEVWCEYRGLEAVPVDIPTDTRRMYLFNNNISSIPDGAFTQLQKLELLDLSSNQLSSDAIKPGVFNGLERLQDVILTGNKLTHIRENTFTEIPSLLRLYLEDNAIRQIDDHAFTNLNNLVELKISRNRLSSFPKMINCPNLRRLYLSSNSLIRLQAETLADVNLEQLTLSSNKLNQLPTTIFRKVTNMRQLDLSENRISKMPRIISNMNSLHSLNLSGNSISFMPDNFLSNLRRMKVLDLRNLRLTTLSESFIPQRVYLNMFDVSGNPWACDCRIFWLTKYMRMVRGAFVRMSQVLCSEPAHLHGRQLVTLHEKDLNCDSDINQPQNRNQTPTVNACDGLSCVNGAECFINVETKKPMCRCQPGWKGVLCSERDANNVLPTQSDKEELFIRMDSITSHSVEILFPTIDQLMTVTTTKLGVDDSESEKMAVTFLPHTNSYKVDNLEPGTEYRICIKSVEPGQSSHQAHSDLDDTLCAKVTTYVLDLFPSESDGNPTDNIYEDGETEQRKDIINKNDGQSFPSENDAKLLFPVLAACVIVFLVAGIGAFFCYRSKRLKSSNSDITEPMSEYRSEKMQYVSEDAMPMMQQQRDYTLIPKSYSGESTTSTHLSDDMYQLPLQQIQHHKVPPRGHHYSSTSDEYMDHEKYDHRRFSPTSYPSNSMRSQTQYSGQDKYNYIPTESPFHKGRGFDEVYPLNNRQEYAQDIKNQGGRPAFAETYRDLERPRTVAVSSRNHFNELYPSPNVKDCGFAVGSTDQVHNSLKLHTNYRDYAAPQLSHSLRLHSQQKANGNLRRETDFQNLSARSATPQRVYTTINPGQKTMVI